MKRLILVFSLAFSAGSVFADSATVEWVSVERATGYKIYISFDLGTTWDTGTDVGNVLSKQLDNIPMSGLVLFRVGAYGKNGETIRYEFGTWYNGDWKPINAVSGVGISK